MTCRQLLIVVLEGECAVCRLPAEAPFPDWAINERLVSITRTPDELSIVCPSAVVPEEIQCERNWRCLRVAGSLPFTEVGILASLAVPLANAGIGIFAISTFETDYLFVKCSDFEKAMAALRASGHIVALADRDRKS